MLACEGLLGKAGCSAVAGGGGAPRACEQGGDGIKAMSGKVGQPAKGRGSPGRQPRKESQLEVGQGGGPWAEGTRRE